MPENHDLKPTGFNLIIRSHRAREKGVDNQCNLEMESSHDHHVNICNANHILVPAMHVQEVQFMLLLPWMMSWVWEQGWLLKLGQQKWRQIWAKRAPCRVPHTCIVCMHKGHAGGGTHVVVKNHHRLSQENCLRREKHTWILKVPWQERAHLISILYHI